MFCPPTLPQAKEAAAQSLMDKLRDEAEKERLSQQKERAVLMKFQQKSEVILCNTVKPRTFCLPIAVFCCCVLHKGLGAEPQVVFDPPVAPGTSVDSVMFSPPSIHRTCF